MSRVEKLYQRLDECEREYLSLVRDEFARLAAGSVEESESILFHWREPHDPAKLDRSNWLEKEICALRRKLGEPIHESIVAIIERFKQDYHALGVKQRNDIFVGRCRTMLEELNARAPA